MLQTTIEYAIGLVIAYALLLCVLSILSQVLLSQEAQRELSEWRSKHLQRHEKVLNYVAGFVCVLSLGFLLID